MSKHWDPGRARWQGQRPHARRPGRGWQTQPRRGRKRRGKEVNPFAATIIFGALFVGVMLWSARGPVSWPLGLGGETVEPRGLWVIDGDTFEHRGTRIRIADIDTPEVRGRCDYEIRLAAQATRRMRALLEAGPFELHRTGTREEDIHGRKLRIVMRDGRSLGGRSGCGGAGSAVARAT